MKIGAASIGRRRGEAPPELGALGGVEARPRAPELYHEELGARGPELVFLPGVGATTRYWKRRVLPLLDSYRITLVDLLGFGRSPKPRIRYTIDRHLAALEVMLTRPTPFTLIGHSFGAIAAIAYAARHPGDVERLVLLSTPYFGSEKRAVAYFHRRAGPERWLMTHIALAAAACIVTRRVLGFLLPRLLSDLPREVAEDIVQHTWRSAITTLWEAIYRYDVAVDMARLPPDLPVLLLHGDQDVTAPIDGARRLAAAHPRSELRILRGVDHHPLLRNPDWVLGAIRDGGARPSARILPSHGSDEEAT